MKRTNDSQEGSVLPMEFGDWAPKFDVDDYVEKAMQTGELLTPSMLAARILDKGLISEHVQRGMLHKQLATMIRRAVRRPRPELEGRSLGVIIERVEKQVDDDGNETSKRVHYMYQWEMLTAELALSYDTQKRKEIGRDVERYAHEWRYLNKLFPGLLPPCPEVLHTEPASTEA